MDGKASITSKEHKRNILWACQKVFETPLSPFIVMSLWKDRCAENISFQYLYYLVNIDKTYFASTVNQIQSKVH